VAAPAQDVIISAWHVPNGSRSRLQAGETRVGRSSHFESSERTEHGIQGAQRQISRILARRGLLPYARGGRRAELATPEGRAGLARSVRLAMVIAAILALRVLVLVFRPDTRGRAEAAGQGRRGGLQRQETLRRAA